MTSTDLTTTPQTPMAPGTTDLKPWYKSPLYIALLAAGAFLAAKQFKIV
jgi:hypothetical protein